MTAIPLVAAIENGLHLMRSSRQSANVPTEDADAIASMEIDGNGKYFLGNRGKSLLLKSVYLFSFSQSVRLSYFRQ